MRIRTIARWRRAAVAGTFLASLGAPIARAQQQEQQPAPQEQPQAQPPADTQAQPAEQPPASKKPAPAKGETAPVVTEQSPRPPPDANVQPVPGAPEEYVIQKGDTLWDLSQKFLNNPWYWPKIWSLNPSIENPHWIYPGNKLRLLPGEGGAPAQVQAPPEPGIDATAANAPTEPEITPSETSVNMPATPDLDVAGRNSREGEASRNTVSVSGKLAFTPPPVVTVRSSGLISPEEMANAGTLAASFEEKEMLATYDTAYVRFRGEMPKPGDQLLAFHSEGDIVSPASGRKLAVQTKTTAVLRVLSVEGNQATVQVERTFEEVGRGDLVRPWTPQEKRLAPKANTADLRGVIVRSVNPDVSTLGEFNEVFVDRGSADGVQEGNTFAVVRRGDGLNEKGVTGAYLTVATGKAAEKGQVPEENVGLLVVVDVSEHVSAAVVIKSVREIEPGDTVEMRSSGSGG